MSSQLSITENEMEEQQWFDLDSIHLLLKKYI